MLAPLNHSYATGIFTARRIQQAGWYDLRIRFGMVNRHPDHDTITRFRREDYTAVAECFLQVLLAKEVKLLKLWGVRGDGAKLKASASRDRSVRSQHRKGENARPRYRQLEGVSAKRWRPHKKTPYRLSMV